MYTQAHAQCALCHAHARVQILSPLVESEWLNMLEGLAPFFRERRYASGQVIFRKGASAHAIYFITCGEVTLWEPLAAEAVADSQPQASPQKRDTSLQNAHLGRRLVRYVNGGIFGELDFFLRHPRSFSAVASTDDCTVQVLTRDALQSMQSQASSLAAALEHALLKYLSFQVGVWLRPLLRHALLSLSSPPLLDPLNSGRYCNCTILSTSSLMRTWLLGPASR